MLRFIGVGLVALAVVLGRTGPSLGQVVVRAPFVRVAVCVPSLRVADPHYNLERTLGLATRASNESAATCCPTRTGSTIPVQWGTRSLHRCRPRSGPNP